MPSFRKRRLNGHDGTHSSCYDRVQGPQNSYGRFPLLPSESATDADLTPQIAEHRDSTRGNRTFPRVASSIQCFSTHEANRRAMAFSEASALAVITQSWEHSTTKPTSVSV